MCGGGRGGGKSSQQAFHTFAPSSSQLQLNKFSSFLSSHQEGSVVETTSSIFASNGGERARGGGAQWGRRGRLDGGRAEGFYRIQEEEQGGEKKKSTAAKKPRDFQAHNLRAVEVRRG